MATLVRVTLVLAILGTLTIPGSLLAAPPLLSPPSGAPNGGDASSPRELFRLMYLDSERATRAARHPIPFDANVDATTADAVAEAAQLTSDAIVALAAQPGGERWLASISRVSLSGGATSAVFVDHGVVHVVIGPPKTGGRSAPDLLRNVNLRSLPSE